MKYFRLDQAYIDQGCRTNPDEAGFFASVLPYGSMYAGVVVHPDLTVVARTVKMWKSRNVAFKNAMQLLNAIANATAKEAR